MQATGKGLFANWFLFRRADRLLRPWLNASSPNNRVHLLRLVIQRPSSAFSLSPCSATGSVLACSARRRERAVVPVLVGRNLDGHITALGRHSVRQVKGLLLDAFIVDAE